MKMTWNDFGEVADEPGHCGKAVGLSSNVLLHAVGIRSKVRIVCIHKQTANEWCWLYMCAVPKISAMRSTNSCYYETIVLMLISAEVMFAPIFGAKILFLPLNVDSHVQYFS